MNYLSITKEDMTNGTGSRVVLWVSGCEHQCKGCRSLFSWDYTAGKLFTKETLKEIKNELNKDYCEGLTLSGGDPLAPNNIAQVTLLCKYFKLFYPNKNIWCYTGYKFSEVSSYEIMKYIDVLVDGRYIEELSTPSPEWCGSRNQRIINVQEFLKA